MLEFATHLVAASGLDAPDYATAIDGLAELRILSPDFVSCFRAIAGFRNVLVYGYLDVDLNLIGRILAERLMDFEEFAASVDAFLQPDRITDNAKR